MVLIRRLRIMGEPYPISEVGEAAPSGIVVPPEHNAVQVEFAAPRISGRVRHCSISTSWKAAALSGALRRANAPSTTRVSQLATTGFWCGPSVRMVPVRPPLYLSASWHQCGDELGFWSWRRSSAWPRLIRSIGTAYRT